MCKIIIVLALCSLLLAPCSLLLAPRFMAQAQQSKKIPRIGYLTASPLTADAPRRAAFREGLREVGYVEGKNIVIEWRSAERNRNRVPELAAELVNLEVDVLVITLQPGIRAARQVTKSIPIVMVTTQDPVALGFIDSLARPGGKIAGVTTLQRELSGKRLEVLWEAFPGIARVAALMNATSIGDFKMYEAPARGCLY